MEYVRAHGHEPEGHWIIIVHPDETSEFYRFDSREEMWCFRGEPASESNACIGARGTRTQRGRGCVMKLSAATGSRRQNLPG